MGNTSVKPHYKSRYKKQVHWKAADRPTPPGKPQLVSEIDVTPDVVTIRWNPPRFDGGSPITGYLVEHRRYGSPHWVRATPLLVKLCELTLSGLEPGWRYQFRVSAENAVGFSQPGELSDLLTVTLQRSIVSVPKFFKELSNAVVMENDKVEFSVKFIEQAGCNICWFKDGFEIFSSRRIRILTENDASVLTIHQTALSDEGEIKCTATNRAGHVSTKAQLAVEAPPSIRLPKQYEDGLLFELGEVIRLKVLIAGRPIPNVYWFHNNEPIDNNERYHIENSDSYSSIRIDQAQRWDRGEYNIKAVNKLSESFASFLVTVTDKPSPPGQAKVIMSLGRSVTISWNTPNDDGGCKIGNYIVEYYRIGWDVWLKAATSRQLSTTIGDLIEGSEYKFRVKAESPYGVSVPSQESDVVFIPDPKRGILTPTAIRKSPDVDLTDVKTFDHTANKVQFYESGVPVRPIRNKIKSPLTSPKSSPVITRRNYGAIDKNIFDRTSMDRDLAYGTPEMSIKHVEEKVQPPKDDLAKYDKIQRSNEKFEFSKAAKSKEKEENYFSKSTPTKVDRTSPARYTKERTPEKVQPPKNDLAKFDKIQRSHEKFEFSKEKEGNHFSKSTFTKVDRTSPARYTKERTPERKKEKSLSPVPEPKEKVHDVKFNEKFTSYHGQNDLSNSNEFMLVLLPGERKESTASTSLFDFEDHSIPPPMSLSAPELGSIFEMFEPMRMAVSSTELLHEHTMARFYEAMAAEEEEMERNRENNNLKQAQAVQIPKIQVNSQDNPVIAGLERRNSYKRRVSNGSVTQPLLMSWNERRHSLKSSSEKIEIPQNKLHKFASPLKVQSSIDEEEEKITPKSELTASGKRELFNVRQRSHSEELEEEEFEKVRQKMASKRKDKPKRKEITVQKLEDWDVEDEPNPSEESYSESDTDFYNYKATTDIFKTPQQPEAEDTTYHPGQLMNQRELDKHTQPFEILTKPTRLPDPNFVPKPILKQRGVDKPLRKNINTNKPNANKKSNSSEKLLSLFPQNSSTKKHEKVLKKRKGSPPPPKPQEIKPVSSSSTKPPPNPNMQGKRTDEEIKVAVDHYGDIVRSYGHKKQNVPRVYLNADDLKAAAEMQVDENSDVDDMMNENSENQIQDDARDQSTLVRKRSFTEASTAILRAVKDKVAAAFASDEPADDIISPEEENMMMLSNQRRGSNTQVRRRSSKILTKSEIAKGKKNAASKSNPHGENWSNLRSHSPNPSGGRLSPSPMRRNSLTPPLPGRRNSLLLPSAPKSTTAKPKMRETTTQTATGYSDNYFLDPMKHALYAAKQEELTAKAEIKVRTTMEYITDLAMFVVACWLYLFQSEILAIPVLLIMVYRQLKEEIKKKLPSWMVGKKKVKRK